ncbi:hypothetical protein NP493_16g06089 [Ridgeia piscesae]|uniref:Probable RNA-binding protein EIF1AD n=1 Tax=Ridgeia piscesae TaxID=27915 RepID=A0AAD9UKV1_RIDPI|nr:hypothetical protein NP493_16g06089 [Ridgeia piscesae]
MSKATKRKHVTKEVLDDYVLPEGDKQVVKVLASRGNNLHEVETAEHDTYLVSMPTKYRKNVWIKRGDFVLVQPIEEGDKVKAEIIHILYKDQIRYIQQEGLWPATFASANHVTEETIPSDMLPPSDEDSDDEEPDLMMVNPNRRQVEFEESSTDEDSDNT